MPQNAGKQNYTCAGNRAGKSARGQEAYVYDCVRTPRGKGKKDGGLHSISPIHLLKNVAAKGATFDA
jgi:hypothetical protein